VFVDVVATTVYTVRTAEWVNGVGNTLPVPNMPIVLIGEIAHKEALPKHV
jgi:hypothetical protein